MSAIVDVFVAMTDRRPYKPTMTAEAALTRMTEEMGAQLDLRLLKLFREMLLDAADGSWS
jgi:HD-GYP domain-containing protein (c-di-GMP phosphodiesterase class II)